MIDSFGLLFFLIIISIDSHLWIP